MALSGASRRKQIPSIRFSTWATVCENPDSDQPLWSVPVRIGDGLVFNKPTILSNGEWLLPVAIHHFSVNRFDPNPPRGRGPWRRTAQTLSHMI